MFASFGVILALMILIFRPEPRPRRKPVQPEKPVPAPEEKLALPLKDPIRFAGVDSLPKDEPAKPVSRPKRRAPESERQLQRELERELKEISLLRSEMQKRLNNERKTRKDKLAKLAHQCETLEPGEAVQILISLDGQTIGEILNLMNRDKALQVATLLQRLGREESIALK